MQGFGSINRGPGLFHSPVLKMKKEVVTPDRLMLGDWDVIPLISRIDVSPEVRRFLHIFMKSGYVSNNTISFIARLMLREFSGLESMEISKEAVLREGGLIGSTHYLVRMSTVTLNENLYIRRTNYLLSSYMQESLRDCMMDLRIPIDQTTLPEYTSGLVSLILEIDQIFLRLINYKHIPDANHVFRLRVESNVLDIEYEGTKVWGNQDILNGENPYYINQMNALYSSMLKGQ